MCLVLENSFHCQVCFLIGLCHASFSLLSRDSVNKFLIAISVKKRLLLCRFESLKLVYAIERAHGEHSGLLKQFIMVIFAFKKRTFFSKESNSTVCAAIWLPLPSFKP